MRTLCLAYVLFVAYSTAQDYVEYIDYVDYDRVRQNDDCTSGQAQGQVQTQARGSLLAPVLGQVGKIGGTLSQVNVGQVVGEVVQHSRGIVPGMSTAARLQRTSKRAMEVFQKAMAGQVDMADIGKLGLELVGLADAADTAGDVLKLGQALLTAREPNDVVRIVLEHRRTFMKLGVHAVRAGGRAAKLASKVAVPGIG